MDKKTVRDIEVAGKRVLVRVDFNVPLTDGEVADDTRIRAALPTLKYLLDRNVALILCSHLGRPKGTVVPGLRMDPVAARLRELLGRPVKKLDDCVGEDVELSVAHMTPGDVVLLENTRFHPEEEANDPAFAQRLARLAEVFVNDAFGSAHRAHASTEGIAHYLPSVGGLLMEKELEFLGQAVENPKHPYVAILGGAKISDKIGVFDSLLGKCDRLLVGGGMANTFFKAMGLSVGDSLVEENAVASAQSIIDKGQEKILLPVDVVVADRFDNEASTRVTDPDHIPSGWQVLDIGPRTIDLFSGALKTAKTVVWNGPLGVFEMPSFSRGTFSIARALADLDAVTVVGGGDSASAVRQAGLVDRITHVSTGGGASLEFLEGKVLPGVAVLADR
jgi:phosphoglycerate kinase